MVRKKERGEVRGQGEDAGSVKYESKKLLRIRMLLSEIVKSTIKLLYGSRNCCPCKLHVLSCVTKWLIVGSISIGLAENC